MQTTAHHARKPAQRLEVIKVLSALGGLCGIIIATPDEQLASWIGAHIRAFEFFQGTPKLVVPDNARTGVTKACRYDPDLNPTYREMAMHYDIGVVPARPYKPRDKAKVESGVQLAERWIIAALLHRGTEPSDSRVTGPHQPAAVSQTRRLARVAVRRARQARAESDS